MKSVRVPIIIWTALVTLWSVILLHLSLAPDPPRIEGVFGWDKLQHAAALGTLAFMTARACLASRLPLFRSAIVGFVYATLFGGLIEILQEFLTTYRQADPLDFAADAAGAFIAVATLCFISRCNRLGGTT